MTRLRSYRELRSLRTIEERFDYLTLKGEVGRSTFGFDRYINQQFYRSREWRQLRNHVIARDNGCDLGVDGFEIHDRIIIHHMNPMSPQDIIHEDGTILDPEYLISASHATHNAIHYGDAQLLPRVFRDRQSGDTKLW